MFSEAVLVRVGEVALMLMFCNGITDDKLHDETSDGTLSDRAVVRDVVPETLLEDWCDNRVLE